MSGSRSTRTCRVSASEVAAMACSSYAIDATCSRFENFVRGPEPWLYAHVQLPAGATTSAILIMI